MTDLNALVQAIGNAAPDAPVRLRRGQIVSVQSNGTCTVTVAGGTNQVAGVKVASSCCPIPNASCWLATDGRDMYVMDTLAPAGPAYGSMRQGSAQSVPTGAFTDMSWTSRTDTTETGVTLGNTGITCVVPGVYTVTVSATFVSNGTGQRHLNIIVNGTTNVQGFSTNAPSGSDLCRMTTATTVKLGVGDVVNATIFQSSGGNLNTQIGASHNVLRIVWIGPAA